MKKFIVYKHTNKSNGKVYIGITCMKPEKRWNSGRGYKPQKENSNRFWNAIQKYGWDNFKHEILYENLEELQAKTLEISLIRFHDSTNPDCGYNISTGGEGTSGYKFSDETKKKISESLKGRKFSDDTRKKISEAKKGYKHSDEHKKNMSKSQHKQRIICIETGVEYESYVDASRQLNVNVGGIYQSCTKGHACKGFHFKKI